MAAYAAKVNLNEFLDKTTICVCLETARIELPGNLGIQGYGVYTLLFIGFVMGVGSDFEKKIHMVT